MGGPTPATRWTNRRTNIPLASRQKPAFGPLPTVPFTRYASNIPTTFSTWTPLVIHPSTHPPPTQFSPPAIHPHAQAGRTSRRDGTNETNSRSQQQTSRPSRVRSGSRPTTMQTRDQHLDLPACCPARVFVIVASTRAKRQTRLCPTLNHQTRCRSLLASGWGSSTRRRRDDAAEALNFDANRNSTAANPTSPSPPTQTQRSPMRKGEGEAIRTHLRGTRGARTTRSTFFLLSVSVVLTQRTTATPTAAPRTCKHDLPGCGHVACGEMSAEGQKRTHARIDTRSTRGRSTAQSL
ncbi:hypothetical protein HDK64DRAFT_261011 [Phyllosticta capitalensis]